MRCKGLDEDTESKTDSKTDSVGGGIFLGSLRVVQRQETLVQYLQMASVPFCHVSAQPVLPPIHLLPPPYSFQPCSSNTPALPQTSFCISIM